MDETFVQATFLLICMLVNTLETRAQVNLDYHTNEIEELVAIPDFRSVKLKWKHVSTSQPLGFFITLCELSRSRDSCFERHLLKKKSSSLMGHDALWSDGKGSYEAVIYDLRMLSNYTAKIEVMDSLTSTGPKKIHALSSLGFRNSNIFFTTKGFSAHATNCQANSSDIIVHTGPHFGGKIAAEASSMNPRCSLLGNRTSEQDVYILRINHRLCGSKTVNGSRIDTMVVVHESSSVVTHNSRRFMVQCTFLPETFTIKASFSIPPGSEESKRNLNFKQFDDELQNVDSNDVFTYEHYKQNNVKDSRMSSVQGPSVLQKDLPGYESQMLILLVVVIVMAILVVVVIGFGLWWYANSHRRRSSNMDIETLSTSGSSIMAYHHGQRENEDDILVRPPPIVHNGIFNDPYAYYHARNMNPFCAGQVALVSLKPVQELH